MSALTSKPFIEECENERDQINSCRHHAERDYSRLYAVHAAAALIAVDTEFTTGVADTAINESPAAEHTESQSECSSGIAGATEH